MNIPIIDCHCHVYPDKIASKAVESIGNFYDLDMFYDGKYSTLIKHGSKIGVKHYVIFSVATIPEQISSINRYIAQTVKQSDGLMTGLGTLHPESENLENEIKEIVSFGLKGVKMHHDFQKYAVDDEACCKIYELCDEYNLPLLLHTGDSRYDFSNPNRVENLLKKYPSLTVIGAHFGGWSCWYEAAEKLSKYDNFYVDCSSSFDWLSNEQAEEIIRMYTPDRVLFGTDFPMWSHESEIKRFYEINLSYEERQKILYKNSAKLFNIEI